MEGLDGRAEDTAEDIRHDHVWKPVPSAISQSRAICTCGIEFVGFRIWATHRKLKKKSARKMKARIKFLQKAYASGKMSFQEVNNSMQSYFGIMKHFNSYNFKTKLLNECVFQRGEDQHVQERYSQNNWQE